MTNYTLLVTDLHASLQSWREVAVLLSACGASRDGAYWNKLARGQFKGDIGYPERVAIARASALPDPQPSPVDAVKASGVQHVIQAVDDPDTAVLLTTGGMALEHITLKRGNGAIEDAVNVPGISVTAVTPTATAKRRTALVVDLSITIHGRTGNFEAISNAARMSALALNGGLND